LLDDYKITASTATGIRESLTSDQPTKNDRFDVPFWRMPSKAFYAEVLDFLTQGFFCALNNSCNVVVIFINFVYIGDLGDPLIHASFGLGVSYFMFLYMSLNLGVAEVAGIECGRWYGLKTKNDKNYQGQEDSDEYKVQKEVILEGYNAT